MDGFGHLPFDVIEGPAWRGVRYFCTTRHGGVSLPPYDSLNLGLHVGDDEAAVLENRARLARALPGPPVWVEQVHGVDVFEADTGRDAQGVRADAILTARPGQALAIMTADCLPVVMGDTEGRALAVAHAGWRGLAAGVLEQTFARLRKRLPGSAVVWRAWIGPGIGVEHFEVGESVRQAFAQDDASAACCFHPGLEAGKWSADLPELARRRLEHMGVTEVWQSRLCTHARADLFFSHRRRQPCGRMATLAWLQVDAAQALPTYPD